MKRPDGLVFKRPFLTLCLSQGISRLGSGVSAIAVVILVYDKTGSGLAVAGILLARMMPSFAAPVAGVISDRVDRRATMVLSDLASGALVLTIAFVDNLAAVYVLVALMATASAVSVPAATASLPELVEPGDLTRANSVVNLALTTAIMGGSALGGALVASVGLRPAFFLDASSFLISASMLATLPSLHPLRTRRSTASPFSTDMWEGVRFALQQRVPLAVIVTGFLLVFFAGSVNPVSVILAKDVLDAGDLGYGLLNAAWGLGMVVGSLGLIAAGGRADPRRTYLLSLLLMSAGLGLTGIAPLLSFAAAALTVGGLGNGLDTVSMNTLLQQAVPNQFRARVFAVWYAALALAQTAALPLGGVLVEFTTARLVYVTASVGLVVTWACALALLSGASRRVIAAQP